MPELQGRSSLVDNRLARQSSGRRSSRSQHLRYEEGLRPAPHDARGQHPYRRLGERCQREPSDGGVRQVTHHNLGMPPPPRRPDRWQGGPASPLQLTYRMHHQRTLSLSRKALSTAENPVPRAPSSSKRSSPPPNAPAMSTSGPSGLGVERGSQAPTSTLVPLGTEWQNCWTRTVLPTPASPPKSTSRPCPAVASRSRPVSSSV